MPVYNIKPVPVHWEPYFTPIEKQEEMKNGKAPRGSANENLSGFRPVVLLENQRN
jgi:hypothetical protein